MRREPDEELALEQSLSDQSKVEVLQVPKAAVNHLRGAAGGALTEIAALDQRNRIAARCRIESDAGAGDPSSDDDHVEGVLLQRGQCLVAGDHSRKSITWSAGSLSGARCSWTGVPRCISPTKRPFSGISTAARPSGVRRTSGVRQ